MNIDKTKSNSELLAEANDIYDRLTELVLSLKGEDKQLGDECCLRLLFLKRVFERSE